MNGTPRTRAYWHKRLKTGYRPTAADFADLVASFSLPGELPDPLPKRSAVNLTDIPIPDPLPAVSGANLLNINPSEWRRVAVPPSYATATSLLLAGDYTAVLAPELRVRVRLTDETWAVSEVKAAAYDLGNDVTTVTLTSALPSNQLAILEYALIQPASAGGSVSRRTLGAYVNPVTAGTDAAYTVNFGVAALVVNALYRVRAHATNLANATLNPDGLGALPLKRLDGATIVAGQLPANAEARLWYDGAAFILLNPAPVFRGALVYRISEQTLTDNTEVLIGWSDEAYDTDALHSLGVNPARLTVGQGMAEVQICANLAFAPVTTPAGIRRMYLRKNGNPASVGLFDIKTNPTSGYATELNAVSAVMRVVAGDYFDLMAFHTQGAAVAILGNANTWFAMRVLR